MSKQKELFKPKLAGKVGMYVCGVTAYDLSHIGHARVYVSFDVLYRLSGLKIPSFFYLSSIFCMYLIISVVGFYFFFVYILLVVKGWSKYVKVEKKRKFFECWRVEV